MKLSALFSLVALTVTLPACGQKPEAPSTQAAPAAESVQKTAPVAAPKAESKAEKAAPVKTESSQVAPAAAPAKPQAAQDAIEEVNQYGREKTKTQVSKARDRAQAAEEDMMRDLEKSK